MFPEYLYHLFPFQTSPKERRKQFGKTRRSQSMDFEDTEELNGPIIVFVSSNSFRRATSPDCSNCSQIQTSRFSHTAIVNISWEVTFQNSIRIPPWRAATVGTSWCLTFLSRWTIFPFSYQMLFLQVPQHLVWCDLCLLLRVSIIIKFTSVCWNSGWRAGQWNGKWSWCIFPETLSLSFPDSLPGNTCGLVVIILSWTLSANG